RSQPGRARGLSAWRTAAPALLEAVLRLATTGLEHTARPLAARCPRCQQRRGVHSLRTRGVHTRLGPIGLQRWWHHWVQLGCSAGGTTAGPAGTAGVRLTRRWA